MWRDLPKRCQVYLLVVYAVGILSTGLCFSRSTSFKSPWVLLAAASFFVASINLRLPQTDFVISMGDVFTILALLHFGAGPALVTYWANVTAATVSSYRKKATSQKFFKRVKYHRVLFNLSCCSLSVLGMSTIYAFTSNINIDRSFNFVLGIGGIALVWFLINTGTLFLAVALATGRSIISVWTDGLSLYLMNSFGSSATAGLISIYYEKASLPVLLLSVPIAVVVYHLHLFYTQRVQQAQSHLKKLNDIFLQTIEAMAMSVDAKDRYTHGHIRRVQIFAVELARCCGVTDEKEIMALRAGALLHDIGKIAIPEYILNKPTVLTASEYEKMKIHPVVGANILKNIEFPYPVMPAVRSHHERWDGRGYPEGLEGEQIPFIARVLALVDCYDALTTDRPYRSPMSRPELEEFFKREAGKAYDPAIVETFLKNMDRLEAAEKEAALPVQDIWGIKEDTEIVKTSVRPLERVQPTVNYSNALRTDGRIQRELYSVFEFSQAEIRGLDRSDVLHFMGRKLENVVTFDAGAFFLAHHETGEVVATKVIGSSGGVVEGVKLKLEQKLSGWVAANNQALCNLPPFPDFLSYPEISEKFALSAIAPMNASGNVVGAISLYRISKTKFTDEEFRRLELLASQTAIALTRVRSAHEDEPVLFDSTTGLPNAFQLHLMFEQISIDAKRYDYPLAILTVQSENATSVRRRFGLAVVQDAVTTAAATLRTELRESDLLTRSGAFGFVVLSPGTSRDQAEALKSRLQDVLDRSQYRTGPESQVSLRASVGISMFPEDATTLRELLSCAENRMAEDRELRAAVIKNRIRPIPLESAQSK